MLTLSKFMTPPLQSIKYYDKCCVRNLMYKSIECIYLKENESLCRI